MKRLIWTPGIRVASSIFALAALTGQALAANEIEIVVVTAERRSVDLQKTPLAATVLTGDDLARRSVTTVDQLMFTTPSLTVNNFGQGNDFNIRGIGKGESNIQTPSGVVTYRDGIPILGGFVQDEPYYDITDVQVLRGPQGTFGGTNATGGVVFINERNADPTAGYSGYGQLQVGAYADVLAQGAINVPLSDTFAARFAVNAERRDSFYTINKGTGFSGDPGSVQRISARASFLWRPTDSLQVIFKTDYNYFDFGGYPADPSTATNDIFHIGNNAPNMAVDMSLRSVLDVKYTFESGISLRSLTGYQYGRASEVIDLDGGNAAPLTFSDIGIIKIWSQELDLVSPDEGPFTWVLGGFFQHETDDLPPRPGNKQFDIGVPQGIVDVVLTYHTPKQHEAVFGQVAYDITDAVQIQLGGRYNNSTFDLVDSQSTLLFGTPIPGTTFVVPCTGPTPACPVTRSGHEEDSKFTGKVALNWKVTADDFLYAFFATGHKDGGQNTTSNQPANILPEEVRNAEVGWKSSFLEGHIRTQVDAYWNDYKNFQVSLFDPTTQTSPILNAPAAKIMGFEAQAQGAWDHFSFDLSLAYLHSRFGSFFAINGGGTPGLTCALHSGGTDPLCQNLTGEGLVYAPNWTANLGGQYAFDIGDGSTLTPRVDYALVGPQWTSVFHSPGVHLQARNILNAQLSYDWANSWDVTAYATNLTDLHYVAAANVSLRYAGPPLQFGVRLTKGF
jgi:iron complex outermembrane receptor protein